MNIFVGNLSLEITEEELRQEFVIFGKVTSIIFMNDQDIGSGQGRKCGYVEMPSVREGELAIEQLHGKSIKGRQLDVLKGLPVTRIPGNTPGDDSKASGFSRKSSHLGRKTRNS